MMLRESFPARSPAARAHGRDLTAGKIAALFDAHIHVTRQDLFRHLRGEHRGFATPAMREGLRLENAVVDMVRERHPEWRVERATTHHRLPEHRVGARPDCWLDDDGVVETKTVSSKEWARWRGRPPLAYFAQTLTQLICADRARGILAVMIREPPRGLFTFDVPRAAEMERHLLDAAAAWWRIFDRGELPPAFPLGPLAALAPSAAPAARSSPPRHRPSPRDQFALAPPFPIGGLG
jgi:hypothetical protein